MPSTFAHSFFAPDDFLVQAHKPRKQDVAA